MRPVEICKRGLCTSKCFSFDLCWSHFDLFCLVNLSLWRALMPCVIVRLHNGVIMHCIYCVCSLIIEWRDRPVLYTGTLAAHAHRGLISLRSLVIASEKHAVVPRSSRPTHEGLGTRLPPISRHFYCACANL